MTVELILGDCLEVMKDMHDKSVDAVITDPPYPDYYTDEYQYHDGMIDFLNDYKCKQLVFWSAKVDFPLDYTAIHIWDKKVGCGSEYERVFERNGQANYKIFRDYFINSTVAASYTGDEFTGHKSQKPTRLIRKMLLEFTNEGDMVVDFFMGSGSIGVACVQTGRNFIGIEIDEDYFKIAERRIKEAQMQPRLL
jgi:site-specific DNA-methyltransferase (adenine-specific)